MAKNATSLSLIISFLYFYIYFYIFFLFLSLYIGIFATFAITVDSGQWSVGGCAAAESLHGAGAPSAPLCKGSWLFGLFYKPKRLRGCIRDKVERLHRALPNSVHGAGAPSAPSEEKSVHGAGAPSAPSEEGAVKPIGFRGLTEGEIHRVSAKAAKYRREQG